MSIVIPAYNEAASIGHVVRDFLPHVDEVVVMDNCSADGTGELARAAGAVVHSRKLRGYGDALRQGMDAATGDILVLVEADGTFRAKDLGKLLEFLKDADMVIGTRTTRADDRAGREHGRHPALGERRRRQADRGALVADRAALHRRRLHVPRDLARRVLGRSGRISRATTPRSRPR